MSSARPEEDNSGGALPRSAAAGREEDEDDGGDRMHPGMIPSTGRMLTMWPTFFPTRLSSAAAGTAAIAGHGELGFWARVWKGNEEESSS